MGKETGIETWFLDSDSSILILYCTCTKTTRRDYVFLSLRTTFKMTVNKTYV